MATPLTLRTRRREDGTVLLTATGELDLSNIEAFSKAIAAAVNDQKDDVARLTVDLSAVEYLDSGAINTLFEHAERIRRIVANPILMPVLTISGLTSVATVEAAEEN
ncbi:STAS domain-containing protein [Mycolicibacterium sp. ND9-15]|uniref:STAS domain-containing protein n=1 Tax=Mycolicibacterium sp. ND9-15 TaxID=3042320 RepID=UPI002DD808C0|nr:STAS domain-containing protein [Mycolicibacterium sp. ND9-15]WSE57210.1 STAS domain-containing protein [Mycolicibacterium sp. ND9-15]